MKKTNQKYFLASNSCEGFISKFKDCYNPNEDWKAYIIKGGPGTGKSSFMKKVAAAAEKKSEKVVFCPCSSDPDSLDGVILPDKSTVILDGTAPHTLDPAYPAVCEEILNFGEFWDSNKLQNTAEIIEITNRNKLLHATAARYLQAAGKLMTDNYKTALVCTKKDKAKNFALKLCQKYIPKTTGNPKEWMRFIGGISPKGLISFPETIEENYNQVVIIKDHYGAAANIIIEELRTLALQNGYEIVTIKNPFLPSILTDHIIIPSLSLAFATENDFIAFKTDSRRTHARRFTSIKQLHLSKERLKFNKKATTLLLNSAAETLKKAKAVHDTLESHYISAMNFEKLNDFTEMFCKKLFS